MGLFCYELFQRSNINTATQGLFYCTSQSLTSIIIGNECSPLACDGTDFCNAWNKNKLASINAESVWKLQVFLNLLMG